MRLSAKVSWTLAVLLVLSMVVLFAQRAEASGNGRSDPDCNGVGNCNDIDIEVTEGGTGYGGDGGEGGSATSDASSESDAAATATSGAEAASSVGDITIEGDTIPADTTHRSKVTLENTPDIVTITPGSGDRCKAHIGFGVAVPGLGTSLNIPLPGKECRKLNYYDRMIASGDMMAAEIIFCSLKEIDKEFRELELDCRDTLSLYIVPLPEPMGVNLSPDEYDELLAQAASSEQVEEYAEQSEYRYAQQQSLLEELQADADDDDAEIERLKREAAELQAARKADEERVETRQQALTALYEKRVAKDEEQDDNE